MNKWDEYEDTSDNGASGKWDEYEISPVQQGFVKKEVNPYIDSLKSFVGNFVTPARAVAVTSGRLANEYIRPIIGKEPLRGEELENRLNAVKTYTGEYEPQTWQGKAAGVIGGTLPYLSAPQLATFKGAALTGGAIGATESLARGDKPSEVALNAGLGSLFGLGGQVALKSLGFGFEKTMPVLGRMSGVKSSNMQRAIDRIKEGGTIFGKKQEEVDAMVNEALESMRNSGNLTKEEVDNITSSIIDKYSKGTPINPQASAVKPQLRELENDINLATFGKKIPKEKPQQEDVFYNNMREEIYKQVDNENVLLPEETKQAIVDSMVERMGLKTNLPQQKTVEEINPVSLHQIKSKLQHDVEFNKESRAYNKQGAALLKELQKNYGDLLKEKYPEYAPAMKEYADAMAAKDFDSWIKTGSIYEIGRALTPIIGGVTGSALTGNPIFTALSLLSSPKAQKGLLEAYSFGSRNITPKLTPTATVTAEKMIPKRSDEYGK